MHDNLIILAGGASSRMKQSLSVSGLTNQEISDAQKSSKALIRLGKSQRPLTDYLLLNAKEAGFKNVYIVVGENKHEFERLYGRETKQEEFSDLDIFFPVQYIPEGREKPFGTADALVQTIDQYPEIKESSFTVCNSDNLYSVDVFKLLQSNEDDHALIAYDRDSLLFSEERISKFAILTSDAEHYLKEITEKPEVDLIEQFKDLAGVIRVSMNIFKFKSSAAYPYLKDCPVSQRGEKEIPGALTHMLKDKQIRIKSIPVSEHVPDLTSKEDIQILKTYLSTHFPDFY